ncbi:MAG: DUF1003 domain-containing protein [Mycobacteriales bacterium]|nr:DUF1003 domain-containing protein [Mycobacteriales bacterium]
MAERRSRLDTPADPRRQLRPSYDPEALGRFSERIARFLGTGRFLVYLTLTVVIWLAYNNFAPADLQFDPRVKNFTLLTLLLSLQASYAAPLILLAQNRQADRDRISLDEDRNQNARLMAEVEYLTREIASLRQALGEVTTRDYLREQLREVTTQVEAAVAGPDYESPSRAEREEREERARRKKRKRQRDEAARQEPASLGEPFAGESEHG